MMDYFYATIKLFLAKKNLNTNVFLLFKNWTALLLSGVIDTKGRTNRVSDLEPKPIFDFSHNFSLEAANIAL